MAEEKFIKKAVYEMDSISNFVVETGISVTNKLTGKKGSPAYKLKEDMVERFKTEVLGELFCSILLLVKLSKDESKLLGSKLFFRQVEYGTGLFEQLLALVFPPAIFDDKGCLLLLWPLKVFVGLLGL